MLELTKRACFQPTKDSIQDGRGSTTVSGGPYWGPLDTDGLRAQAKAKALYERFDELARFALNASIPALFERFEDNRSVLLALVNQVDHEDRVHGWSANRLLDFKPALAAQIGALKSAAFMKAESQLVPDTNVVLAVPNLQKLAEGLEGECTIVIVPTVIHELDKLKASSRSQEVREKARGAIRRLKEMRRRGNLLEGVPLEGKLRLRATAHEPKAQELVSWLEPVHQDDRLLAATMDVARRNLSGTTRLVTSDLNLQNKAALVGVAFLEPKKLPKRRSATTERP
jgi:rRNA-processing protein FCF1